MTGDILIARRPDGWRARRPADGWQSGPHETFMNVRAAVEPELGKLGVERARVTMWVDPGEACDEPRAG